MTALSERNLHSTWSGCRSEFASQTQASTDPLKAWPAWGSPPFNRHLWLGPPCCWFCIPASSPFVGFSRYKHLAHLNLWLASLCRSSGFEFAEGVSAAPSTRHQAAAWADGYSCYSFPLVCMYPSFLSPSAESSAAWSAAPESQYSLLPDSESLLVTAAAAVPASSCSTMFLRQARCSIYSPPCLSACNCQSDNLQDQL